MDGWEDSAHLAGEGFGEERRAEEVRGEATCLKHAVRHVWFGGW
jgi:hypothetical protein